LPDKPFRSTSPFFDSSVFFGDPCGSLPPLPPHLSRYWWTFSLDRIESLFFFAFSEQAPLFSCSCPLPVPVFPPRSTKHFFERRFRFFFDIFLHDSPFSTFGSFPATDKAVCFFRSFPMTWAFPFFQRSWTPPPCTVSVHIDVFVLVFPGQSQPPEEFLVLSTYFREEFSSFYTHLPFFFRPSHHPSSPRLNDVCLLFVAAGYFVI